MESGLARPDDERGADPSEDAGSVADAAYRAGDLEAAIATWERACELRHGEGDAIGAAEAAAMVAMYLMMDTGLMAPVRGWLARADDLMAGLDDTPVHALIAMVRMYERFMCGDMGAADTWSAQAVELGQRHGVVPAVTLGRTCRARLRIFDGDIAGGLAALDEVADVLSTGTVDALTTGMVWCELVCAVQGLGEHERATEWTQAMDVWGRDGTAFGGIVGRCRVHRAEMLRLRGSCDAAEDEALQACEELRPWMRREFGWPLTELGTIRLRRGDLAGAQEAFLAAYENAWDPQPGLALLRLAQGDVPGAAELIRDALRHPFDVPSKERPPNVDLRRAPLLEAQVAVAAAGDDLATATGAADDLDGIARRYASPGLSALAALARGRVALLRGQAAEAVTACEQAVATWVDVGAPWDAAQARLVLAHAQREAGNETRARLEFEAAASAFRRVCAEYWAAVADEAGGGTAAAAPTDSVGSALDEVAVFTCDGDTRTITFAGRTVLVRDLKGLRHLARLLAEPGREFHALDLTAVDNGVLPSSRESWGDDGLAVAAGDAGAMLDDTARDAYRRRLVEIDEDIDEATHNHDLEPVALARADRDYLVRELSRAVGLGGRARRAQSTSERARVSVTRALRYALARVAEHHPELADHLDHAVRTGTYCCYEPDPRAPITWRV